MSTLESLFTHPLEEYPKFASKISKIYQSDPTEFAQAFFDTLSTINPKIVRIVCYLLYVDKINLTDLYHQYNGIPNLKNLPDETLYTILRYDFPAILPQTNDLFFIDQNLTRQLLEIVVNRGINLNHINGSTGESLLHRAVRDSNLSNVLLLLSYRVDPNIVSRDGVSPMSIALKKLNRINLHIIRYLRMYGAKYDLKSQDPRLLQMFSSSSQLKPFYEPAHSNYYQIDNVEDLSLLSKLYPNTLNPSKYKDCIEEELSQSVESNYGLLTWPLFINESKFNKTRPCFIVPDNSLTAANPPNFEQVYDQVYQDIPEPNIPDEVYLPTVTPAALTPFDGPLPLDIVYTFPLTNGPMVPVANPGLPSL